MSDSTCANPECDEAPAPPRPTGPRSPYCSKRCRTRADYLRRRESTLSARREASAARRIEKVCPQCGTTFIPGKTIAQRFCSLPCGRLSSNAAWRAARGECSEEGCKNRSVSRSLCRQHHPSAGTWSKSGNPETRRANLRRKTQLRRARLGGDPDAESIDRDEIGERDGWRCGLCSLRVDRSLPWPHPQSASLDHIEPLSRGGKHTKSNVQIAHLTCNVVKGNRGGGEQLLLIG